MTAAQPSSGYSPVGACGPPIPALLTATSSRPNASTAAATIASQAAGSVTSTTCGRAASPMAAATASAGSARTSATRTFAPRRASSVAQASPMPDPAPVTIATLPANSSTGSSARRRGWASSENAPSQCAAGLHEMTDGAERMAAQAPMGDAERLARDVEHPEPGSAGVGDLRPRPPTRVDDVVLHDAHDPGAPGFDSVLKACRDDVFAAQTHHLPGVRPVVDTAWHREIRVDTQLHHEYRAGGVGPDRSRTARIAMSSSRSGWSRPVVIQAALHVRKNMPTSPRALNAWPSSRKRSPLPIALAGTRMTPSNRLRRMSPLHPTETTLATAHSHRGEFN